MNEEQIAELICSIDQLGMTINALEQQQANMADQIVELKKTMSTLVGLLPPTERGEYCRANEFFYLSN